MTTTAAQTAPETTAGDDGLSHVRHAYCTWCNPARVVAELGAVAACGYRRPPGPIAEDSAPTCVVCEDLVAGGRTRCPNPACPSRFVA